MSLNYSTEQTGQNGRWNGVGLWRGTGGKDKMKNREFRLLQLFADGEESGAVVEKEGNAPSAQEGAELEPANIPQSFDDFLSNGGQAEFDRRVNKAVQTAVANAQKKCQTITDSKVSEAEKLSQMAGEEKERYRADKAEQEIALGEMAKASVKGFTKMFKNAVQAAVKEELRGNVPKGGNGNTKTNYQKTDPRQFKYILCCYLSG